MKQKALEKEAEVQAMLKDMKEQEEKKKNYILRRMHEED